MSSAASPGGAWPPYDSYRDCSRGICSIYCPQWCYIIFPPPPPPADSDSGSGTAFSPLIIAIIGILASAFLLVSYYTIVTRYCRRRRESRNSEIDFDARRDEAHPDQWRVAAAGLDDSLIKSITVFKYLRSDKLVEGTECAVCLNEFKEEEDLRLLPKCCHAFHIPCIDTWLKSQSNCPLCRATVNPYAPISPLPGQGPAPNPQTSSAAVNVSSLEIQRGNDLVFVVEDPGRNDSVSVGVGHVCDEQKENRGRDDPEPGTRLGRSVSLGVFSGHRNLLVSQEPGIEIGCSRGIREGEDLVAVAMMRRCSSTGRFDFTRGKMHILPPS